MASDLRTLIAEIARRTPDALALAALDKRPATYQKLLQQMEKTARTLASKGAGRKDRVAVVMPNGPEMASLFLGTSSVATCAPLNPSYSANEFEFYLADLSPKLVIVDAKLDSAVRPAARTMSIEVVELHDSEPGEAGSFELAVDAGPAAAGSAVDYAAADDVALVLHTSGTTSRPKLVPLTHENLCISALNIAKSLGLTADDCCLNIMPLFHVHGLLGAVLSSLCVGGRVACSPGYHATEFFAWLAEFHPTWYTGVPTMHHGILLRAVENHAAIAANPLRFIRSCSAALAPQLMAQMEEAFGAPVLEAYGMTEAAHQITCNALPPGRRKAGSVGRPSGVEVAILNEAGAELAAGVEGEVAIRGRNVTRGYENNPEANGKSFTNGWFRTGDRGRIDDDGELFLTGRIKELIVRGGEKIAPREIDETLLRHPAVEQALGFAVPDAVLGEKVAAAVVLKAGASVTELELCEHVGRFLAPFKVPERVVFVAELPKGPTGKAQRIGLAEKLGLCRLDPAEPQRTKVFCAPRNDIEVRLAELWSAVLKLERAGIHDNFLHAGGDSVLAIQLMARIRKCFGVELSVTRLFQCPTIAKLAEFIAGQSSRESLDPALPSVSRAEGVLLSSAQQRMWFLAQLTPDIPSYNRPFAYRMKGSLDLFRLQTSLSALVKRHEVLRTNYCLRDGIVEGVVRDAAPVSIALVDFSVSPTTEQESATRAWMRRESEHLIDLATDPVLRCAVARLAPDEHVLLFVVHHIACDATTETVMIDELSAAYNGTLPDAPCAQYADYASWQCTRQARGGAEKMEWWRRHLEGMEGIAEIRPDFPRTLENPSRSGTVSLRLDSSALLRSKALARSANTTVFTVLLAAFYTLLHRYTGLDDLTIGTVAAVRNHPSTESMVGMFINILVLRTSAAGDPTFRAFLERVRETASGGLAHQEVPFDAVVDALRRGPGAARSSLFQAVLEYRNVEKPRLSLEGVAGERLDFDRTFARFDLTLDIEPAEGGLRGKFLYHAGLFEQATIERMAQHFETLLSHALSFPDEKLSQLRLTTAEEQSQLLAWGRNSAHVPTSFVQERFEEQAAKTPDAVAAVFQDCELTYAELNRRANRLAHSLIELGVKPDSRVAICVERSFEMIVGVLAILKAGGAYVPLDPACPAERLRFLVEDCAPAVLLADGQSKELFSFSADALPVLDLKSAVAASHGRVDSNPDQDRIGLAPNHLAYVIYTSGTSGVPKGVMVEHRNLSNYIIWAEQSYYQKENGGSPTILSLSFDGLVTALFPPLTTGQTLTILPNREEIETAFPPDARLPYALVKVTPSHLKMLNEKILSMDLRRAPTRALMMGGETLVPADVHFWQLRFPGVRLVNHFGPTEATVGCCTFEITTSLEETTSVPIGRPIANARIYILDKYGQPVPVGVPGELYIGGAGVARGYLHNPELTAAKFLKDPFADAAGARMYRSGDVCRWLADGSVEFLGRNDFQVKIRGFRVEPGEIEAHLAKCTGVEGSVVIAREDRPGENRLVAYYIGEASARQLRQHLAACLSEPMVPAAYVRLDAWPLTPNGKLDRKALPVPDTRACASGMYEPPRDEVEAKVAAAWSEVLHRDSVGRNENFFEMGGHSLLIAKLLARLQSSLGVRVPVATVFQHPTLQEFARRVAETIRAAFPRPDTRPLGPLLWLGGGYYLREINKILAPLSEAVPIWLGDAQRKSYRPPFSIEGMARAMVEVIRGRYSDGPYMLAGRCMSGVLAYETAQQLRALGSDVALLVLVGAGPAKGKARMTLTERMLHRFSKERLYWRRFVKAPSKEQGRSLRQRWRNLHGRFQTPSQPLVDLESEIELSRIDGLRILDSVLKQYQPQPYRERLAYFQPQENDLPHVTMAAYTSMWRRLAVEHWELHEIPGDHWSMMKAPHIEVLAEKIRQSILAAAEERSCSHVRAVHRGDGEIAFCPSTQ